VGKIYGGLLILENWKATKFGNLPMLKVSEERVENALDISIVPYTEAKKRKCLIPRPETI
jgi:hypothetical protein